MKNIVDGSGQPIRSDGKLNLNPKGKVILSSEDIFKPRIFANTIEFKRSAMYFMKYNCYTKAPRGSREYNEFWKEETRRCRDGYWSGDLWITGKHYFYLNYIQLEKVPDPYYLKLHPHASPNRKVTTFPDFWEVDLRYWYAKELAQQNAENGIPQGHMVTLKTRRGGFSFKEACEGVYNYYFYPKSHSKYFAFDERYLKKDGIFNKVGAMLNFIDYYDRDLYGRTTFRTPWAQNRVVNNGDHKISGYRENGIIKGRQAQLSCSVLDNPEKGRGGDYLKVVFEEFGSFKGGLDIWTVMMPTVKQGSTITGFMSAFGTGNNSKNDSYIEALEEMFYNPEAYDCIAFDNIWDEDMEGTKCGFFVPVTEIRTEFADKDSNLNREAALQRVLAERDLKVGTKQHQGHIIENPLSPEEALTRIHNSLFDIERARKAKKRLENDGRLDALIHCKMIGDFNQPNYVVVSRDKAYNEYPVKQEHEKTGCVVISEIPYLDDIGKVPDNMYFAVHDPYSKDEVTASESIGSAYIIKRTNKIDGTKYDKIVAWFNGRPKTRLDYNRQLFLLISYYNAKLQFEIDGGGQGIVEFARNSKHNLLHLLYTEPEMLHNKEIAGKNYNKTYGVKLNVNNRANVFLEYLSDWLMTSMGLDDNGNEVLIIDTIEDIGLLQEIIRYKDDMNADRLSAARIIPMMVRELEAIQVKNRRTNSNSFFNRPLYQSNSNKQIKQY